MFNSPSTPSERSSTREPSTLDGWLDEIGFLAYEAHRAVDSIPFTAPEAFVDYTRRLAAAVGELLALCRRVTGSPVGSSGVSGPVDGRSVAEIRADLRSVDLSGVGAPTRRLVADVPALLAEVEAAHRFEVSAAAESAGLANRLNGVAAERDELRGVVQAVESLAKNARPSLSLSPADCTDACQDGDCNCSGVPRVRAWNLDPAAVLAALHPAPLIGADGLPHHVEVDDAGTHSCLTDCPSCAALAAGADAPQPEPEKITYGPRVPSRRVDLGEWDSHRPDFLPDSSSSPVQPADPPTCEHGRTVAHQMPNTYALVICPGPSPAVLPEKEQR